MGLEAKTLEATPTTFAKGDRVVAQLGNLRLAGTVLMVLRADTSTPSYVIDTLANVGTVEVTGDSLRRWVQPKLR